MKRLEVILICVCVMLTLGLFFYTQNTATKNAEDQFRRLANVSVKSLEIRMATYLQSLNGAAAVLTSAEIVSRTDFSNYVSTLKIAEHLPGINGIGLITPILAGEEQAFYEKMAIIGEDRLTITPDTDGPERFIIERISPFASNEQALGLDITFEQGRRDAAERARATGLPQLTPRILLVQDSTRQPGFLLLLPVFEQQLNPAEGTAVRGPFVGWVYAPFVGVNLLNDLAPDQGRAYDISVYDGAEQNADLLIYQSGETQASNSQFEILQQISLFGRDWLVAYHSSKAFELNVQNEVPLAILICGFALTGMLTFTVRNQGKRTDTLRELAALRAKQITSSEQENRAIVENAVTPIFVLGAENGVLFANKAAQMCFGYDAEEMRKLTFSQLTQKVADASEDSEYNATGATKSGQMLFLDVGYNKWLTSDGEMRMTAIVHDLSSEIEAVNELKKTKARYDMALAGSGIGVFDIDLVAGRSEASDTWYEIMGYRAKENDGDPQDLLRARVHPDDVEQLDRANMENWTGKTYRSTAEFRVSFPQGDWRWMHSDAIVVERDEDGQALQVIGTQTDITDLRDAHNALEQSEQRFRQVVSSAPIGMALMSSGGAFYSANEAFCTLCGHDEIYLQNDIRLSDIMPTEDSQDLYSRLEPRVDAEKYGVYRGEHRVKHRSGEERWGLFNISWNYDKSARQNMFIAQVNDITDRKEIEQVKNEFVSTVSHELRTPLTSIKGALGLIHAANGADLSPGSKRLVEIARSNTDRLAAIVNDILDLEKISSGDVPFEFGNCDMRDLITSTLKEMSPFAQEHDNVFRMDCPDRPFLIRADASRTKQVLTNLISNACKYSLPASEIIVRVSEVGGQILTEVENAGSGIPESFRPRIFEAFSQADASDTRAKGGTGLGLNISHQIVARHDGLIGFDSTPGDKTRFWFSYPVSLDQSGRKDVGNAPHPPGVGTRQTVLHIEDDIDFAEVVRSGLADVADVTNATTLAEARGALLAMRNGIDVLIMDWALPDGDAAILLDDIFLENPSVRVLGLSADPDRRKDPRVEAYLIKTRTELDVIAAHVAGEMERIS